ncbi:hypothetical protein V2J09_022970 [Rumex salicifolius]
MKRNPTSGFITLLFTLSFITVSCQQEQYSFPNPRLESAYVALQAWKRAIASDPNNATSNWVGCDVCSYTGVYCAPAPDDSYVTTVAGIDLNHANLAGYLPDELGLLTDLSLFHLNSNRFTGSVPATFCELRRLHELDISNNKFCGEFPNVVLSLPSLKFLDIRFNDFQGKIPDEVFNKKLDALFLNSNNFTSSFPPNLGNSTVSVLVLANNPISGCLPPGISDMGPTLEEIILLNISLRTCLPTDLGRLKNLKVLDVSFNRISGFLPESIGQLSSLEQLNVAHNQLTGEIPDSVCGLPRLQNFTFSYNFFCGEPQSCSRLKARDDKVNCIPYRPFQRSVQECQAFLSYPPVDCNAFGCGGTPPPPPPPYPPSHQLSPSPSSFSNPRLQNAFIALQAWKKVMFSDPNNLTSNWRGAHVCSYNGVFCAPAPDNSYIETVAGIDLNHANIAGHLPNELGLLKDLALFHINTNRFSGSIPKTFSNLHLLFELDLSNNRFHGSFPNVVQSLPSLKFLDIRYNNFNGTLPSGLFDMKLDALFINNNKFKSMFPQNIGNSPVSVAVLANNNLSGCLPSTVSNMADTLDEIVLMNVGLKSCLPSEVGKLKSTTVFDVSKNMLSGPLPSSIGNMKRLEKLNVAHNKLSGNIPSSICSLPNLISFNYSFNFFTGEPAQCLKLKDKDDKFNCITNRPMQQSAQQCNAFLSYPEDCRRVGCSL